MKKIKIFLIALLFATSTGALFAQQGRVVKPKARRVQGVLSPQEPPENIKISGAALEALPAAQNEGEEIPFESLSLSEKLAQTIVISTDIDTADRYRPAIERGLVGGVLIQWGNYSLAQTKDLVDKLQNWAQKSPSKIPLLIAIDYEGGTVYTPVTLGFPYLPTNMMLAAANNIDDTIALFFIVAQELKNVGVHINFAPVMDVNINPANPIIGVRS
jgi:hypothetical protein